MKKKLLSVLLAVCIVIVPFTVFAQETDSDDYAGYLYLSVERNTLGQGFIREPEKVGYYEGENLAQIVQRYLGDDAIFSGSDSSLYLSGINDGGEPEGWTEKDVPADIYNYVEDYIDEREDSGILAEQDYTPFSGYTFSIDNNSMSTYASSVELGDDTSTGSAYKDGSVIRIMYTIYGWGFDVGFGYEGMGFEWESSNTFADRSELIKAVADINANGKSEEYGKAYDDAVALLSQWNITEDDINKALDNLKASKPFDGYLYFTVERNTLGQGLILEPVKVGYFEDESLAAVTERALGEKSTYKGDLSAYYLTGVVDGGEPENWTKTDIPSDILNAVGGANEIDKRAVADTLSSFDYFSQSGYMFTVDNTSLNAGAGSIYLGEDSSKGNCFEDDSVVRVMYTVYGWGEDVGVSFGYFKFDTTNTFADRSELIKAVADINYEGTSANYGEAYTYSVKLLNTWNVSEEEIDTALYALQNSDKQTTTTASVPTETTATETATIETKPSVTTEPVVTTTEPVATESTPTETTAVVPTQPTTKTTVPTAPTTKKVKATKLTLNKYNKTLNAGKTFKLTATVKPTNATNKAVSFTTKNKNVVTVTAKGKVTAKAKGTTYVTVKTKDGSNLSAKCKFTVKQPVKKIVIKKGKKNVTGKTITLKKGGKLTLKATVSPSNANKKTVKWSTSRKNVATVKNGKVTAKSKGKTVIKAVSTDGSNKSAKVTVKVK
ncbi:MAG: Ig-like domain-containing protein [Ruminococcus sp.]|nr:Ig-like domain-containing protein [Ruminococcus sp.]